MDKRDKSRVIVGLGYQARTGKDSVADYLVNHGFVKRPFAESLKGACREIFHLTTAQLYGDEKEKTDPFWTKSPRELLQWFGTDVLRQHAGDDIWVASLHRWLCLHPEQTRVVIPDVRFYNEATYIRDAGGILVRCICLDGPTLEAPRAAHASETSLATFEWPHTIVARYGELSKLYERMDQVLALYALD